MTTTSNLSVPKGTKLDKLHSWNETLEDVINGLTEEQKNKLLIGGPGLTADALGLNCNAKTGRMYFLITQQVKEVEEVLVDILTQVKTDVFDSLFINEDCAIAILNPERRLPKGIKQEDIRPLNTDCLLKFVEGNPQLLLPTDLSESLEIGFNKNLNVGSSITFIYGPLAQIASKCYSRMGFSLSEKLLKELFLYRCSLTGTQQTPLLFQVFVEEFQHERITQIT